VDLSRESTASTVKPGSTVGRGSLHSDPIATASQARRSRGRRLIVDPRLWAVLAWLGLNLSL